MQHTVNSEIAILENWNDAKRLLGSVGWLLYLSTQNVRLVQRKLPVQLELIENHQNTLQKMAES